MFIRSPVSRALRATSVLLAGVALFSQPSAASILTFDYTPTDLTCGGNGCNPQDYGDRITTTNDVTTGYQYGLGNGFTPNVTVSYQPDPTFTNTDYSLWATGYAELSNALGHISFNVPGEIILTPDSGYSVRLNSFDIAGWAGAGYQTQFAIYDDNGTRISPNLFGGDIFVPGANSISPLSSPLLATGALHIYISNLGSTGIDNLNFDQTAVPLPAAIWLFGSGLLGMIGMAKRKKTA